MKVITFAAGLAAGYVLGSRAGREKYEQIVAGWQKVSGQPAEVRAQDEAGAVAAELTTAEPDVPAIAPRPRPTRKATTTPKTTPTPTPVVGVDPSA
jgi:hypothetical protein